MVQVIYHEINSIFLQLNPGLPTAMRGIDQQICSLAWRLLYRTLCSAAAAAAAAAVAAAVAVAAAAAAVAMVWQSCLPKIYSGGPETNK